MQGSDMDIWIIISSSVASTWEETTAFQWWFKARQLSKRLRDCHPRSNQWAAHLSDISRHVPFYPSLDLICFRTPNSLAKFMQATLSMNRSLKRRAHIALPFPPVGTHLRVQPYWLEKDHLDGPSGATVFYPPLSHGHGSDSESRVDGWLTTVAYTLRNLEGGALDFCVCTFSTEDVQLLQAHSLVGQWIFSALGLATAKVRTLTMKLQTLDLPRSEHFVWRLFVYILRDRDCPLSVKICFSGASWSKCALHRRFLARAMGAFQLVPHPFDIVVECTHYGSQRNATRFHFPGKMDLLSSIV